MEQLKTRAQDLKDQIGEAKARIKFDDLVKEVAQTEIKMQAADFWQNNKTAQNISKKHAGLSARIRPWQEISIQLDDLSELIDLNDKTTQSELETQLKQLEDGFTSLKKELQFRGPFDDHDVILGIYAGAGGTDAQDWAQMLLRMYVRWAEGHKLQVKTIDQSNGEEAGIKSATLEISGGGFLYGKLAGEHGVHRLVRLSPFNADNLRQTSFAKVEVLPIIDKPEDVQLDEKDIKIDVYRAGGHGGQSVNTTDSAVRVTHLPTGINVAIQNERSQLQNKETALKILRSKLVQLQLEQHAENLAKVKGPNQSAEWGNQIRNYVLHPYKQVKDTRTGYESTEVEKVLDGNLDPIIDAWLEHG